MPKDTAIKVDEELVLVLITADGLRRQGIAEEQVARIMEDWQRQKSGIEVEIEFKDVFDNKQPVLKETLS